MLWLLHHHDEACPECGTPIPRRSQWCGGCGARIGGRSSAAGRAASVTGRAAAVDPAPPPAEGPARGHRAPWQGRRAPWRVSAVLAIALAVVVVASQVRDDTVHVLLGQMDVATGVSAVTPPPEGLQVAWTMSRPGAVTPRGEWIAGWLSEVVADGSLVRTGDRVMDIGTGRLVRVATDGPASQDQTTAVVDSGELVVLDALTGAVLRRSPVPEEWAWLDPWAVRRTGEVTLLSHPRGSLLVGDDGSVLAALEQTMLPMVDRAWGAPVAYPVRGFDLTRDGGTEEVRSPLTLVRADTGGEVLTLPGGRTRTADVVGGLALVASTDALADDEVWTRHWKDMEWSLLLVDASTGQRLQELEVTAMEAPRLLGLLDDGTAVISVLGEDGLDLVAALPDGAVDTVVQGAQLGFRADAGFVTDGASLGAAAVTQDVLVVQEEDRLVGRAGDGRRRWEVATSSSSLSAAGSHVVAITDTGAVDVRRGTDGAVVASFPPLDGSPWGVGGGLGVPVVVVEGRVGLGNLGSYRELAYRLNSLEWVDLRSGRSVTSEEVLRFLPADGARGGGSWRSLLGTVVGRGGPGVPVFGRLVPGAFELFEPGRGVASYPLAVEELALGWGDEHVLGRALRPVGGSADWLVLWSQRQDPTVDTGEVWSDQPLESSTHLVDRTAGTLTTVADVRALLLAGEVVVGEEHDAEGHPESLVGLDVATGQRLWGVSWPGAVLSVWPGTDVATLAADHELLVHRGLARITARSVRDGTLLWRYDSPVELLDHAVLGPERVVTATTDGQVLALDRADGSVLWRTSLGIPVAALSGAGDHVVVGTHDGLVVQLDGDGMEVQRIAVGAGPVHAVHALGDTVVATVDSSVVGLRADASDPALRDRVDVP